MAEKEPPKCSSSKRSLESNPTTTQTEDDGSILGELLMLPSRKKPVTDVHLTPIPYLVDDSLGFSFPPIESEPQLLEKIRLQDYQVELNAGANLRRNLFVRRKEWLKITSSLKLQLPPEEKKLEVPILSRLTSMNLSRTVTPQCEPIIYPIPKHIVAPMASTMWFDVEHLLSNCKAHEKIDGIDIQEAIREKHKPFDVVLSPMPDEDGRHREKFKFIPEEERDHIKEIILPSKSRKNGKVKLPAFETMNAENLPVLQKQDWLQKKFEADISLLTNMNIPTPPLSIDPVDMMEKKGMALVANIRTCYFEKSIFRRRRGLEISDMIPQFPKSSPSFSTEDGMKEVRKLRLFRRHEQTWWSKGPQEMMTRCGHLAQLQRTEKDEIPALIEMGKFDDADLFHFPIDREERTGQDMEIIGEAIQDFLLHQDIEEEEPDDDVVFSTRELLSLGFKFFPSDIVAAGIIREDKNEVLRETYEVIGMEQGQSEGKDGNEDTADDCEDLQDILDIY